MPSAANRSAAPARERLATRARHILPRGQTLPADAWRRRHRALLVLLWLHVPAVPVYGMLLGYSAGHTVMEAAPIAALALLGTLVKNQKLASAAASLGLLACSAVVVHFSGDVTEAHFYFFVVVVMLTLYEDWTPFLLAVGFVLLHHGLSGVSDENTWGWALIHALFVGAAGAAAVIAWRLNEEVRHQLRVVVDSSGDAILEVDRSARIVRSNVAAQRGLGYTAAELEGRPVASLLATGSEGDARDIAGCAAKGEQVHERETTCLRADGTPIDLSLTVSPVTDTAGRVVGASIFARDVTAARRQGVALAEAEARFRGAFDGATIGMALVAPDGRWLQVNDALSRIVGYDEEALLSGSFQDITHPDDLEVDLDYVRRVLAGELSSYQMEKRYVHREGHIVWVNLSVSLVRGSAGEPLYFVSQVEDISERRAARERLRKAEKRYRSLVERVPAITYVAESGPDGRWHYVSPQIEQMLGYTPEEWQDDPSLWFSRIHPEDRERVLLDEVTEESIATEYRMRTRGGKELWVRDEGVFRGGTGPDAGLMEGILTDITERKVLEEKLRHMASHDEMTGLVNRGRFREDLGRAVANAERHGTSGAVLLLDLDNFKEVNDSLGHRTGDRLLGSVATALEARLRGTDVVARLGGDEFAVLLAEADSGSAAEVAADIVTQVRALRLEVDGRAVRTTASVGIVLLSTDGATDADRLLMEADIAMYRAKAAGGDGWAEFSARAYTG